MSKSLFPEIVVPRSTKETYRRRLQAQILRHGLYRGDVHADSIITNFPPPAGVHANVIGLSFSGLADAGLIEATGFQRSTRKARHRGVSRLWRIADAKAARQYLRALASTGDDYGQ